MRVFISAGEVSGDMVGALLAGEIWKRSPDSMIFGVGGSRMEAAGVTIDFGTNHLGTVGITEAFLSIPAFIRALGTIRKRVRRDRPDVAVLIGNDVFNVLLGRWLKGRRVPTVSYFPPQVWIWRSLARPISKSFDMILASFPDEQRAYERTGTPTRFVGHYLRESLRPASPAQKHAARVKLGLPVENTVVGLMPGSRLHEVRRLAPVLLDAAVVLKDRDPSLRFVLPVAEPLYLERISAEIERRGLSDRIRVTGNDPDAIRASDLLLLASGTASLEAALLDVPMVIIYRVSRFTIWVVRTAIRLGLMDSETMGLPNLVLGRVIVPELRQETLSVSALVRVANSLLEDPVRAAEIRDALKKVRALLSGGGVIGAVADAVLERAAGAAGSSIESSPVELHPGRPGFQPAAKQRG